MRAQVKVLCGLALATSLFASCQPAAAPRADLSTPEATVLSYCRSGSHDLRARWFAVTLHPAVDLTPQPLHWQTCEIVSVEKTKRLGQRLEDKIIEANDVEVVMKASFTDKAILPQSYLYVLRRFADGWKIIGYTILGEPEPAVE
jgi:hypothetical protein